MTQYSLDGYLRSQALRRSWARMNRKHYITHAGTAYAILALVACGEVGMQQDVRQQHTIDYLITESQVLKEKLEKKRILLNNGRRLAIEGKVLGRKLREELASSVSPNTLLRRHQKLVAQKWKHSDRGKKQGRPRVSEEVTQLVLQLARANSSWGYDRIQGAPANLGHQISTQPFRHFHVERNHQGLGNRLIEPGEEVGRREGDVLCRERLGGMLR